VKLHPVEGLAPGLAARIAGADRGDARRFAFRVARLACAVAHVHDRNALEVAREGLEHYPEIEELVALWDLERDLDSACEAKLGTHPDTCNLDEFRLHDECVEARAVGAVISAMKPDAIAAARQATHEALAAGCATAELEALADELLVN
jgi:hypothetical protein